jgi:hypothetical protein
MSGRTISHGITYLQLAAFRSPLLFCWLYCRTALLLIARKNWNRLLYKSTPVTPAAEIIPVAPC